MLARFLVEREVSLVKVCVTISAKKYFDRNKFLVDASRVDSSELSTGKSVENYDVDSRDDHFH